MVSSPRHVVAVASGKGGVGKSTVTNNLAAALTQQGLSVGLLDADIYGPSQQLMLGVPESITPDQQDGEFLLPVEAHGLKTMSMGYLSSANTPMVWRGPMASSAMAQLLEKTLWGDLDILLVDMPPGTGDIQLTLAQRATLSGAVIVTTPQDIAPAGCPKRDRDVREGGGARAGSDREYGGSRLHGLRTRRAIVR